MIIVKRDEFKKLLENNPGKKFAFYEYTPCTFISELHITMGEEINPTFGAYAVDSPGPFDEEGTNILGDPYDWNINEYSHKDLFAILEPSDLNPLANMLIEASKDYLESDMSPINAKSHGCGESEVTE